MIDTLELSRRLHEAGMAREAAEALTEGLADAFEASVASKNDPRATEERLVVRIDAGEHRMDERFAVAEQREDEKLASLENRLTARMEAFHWRTLAGMAAMLLAHLIVIRRLLAA